MGPNIHTATGPRRWLIGALIAGAPCLAVWLFAWLAPHFPNQRLVLDISAALLALALIVAAVAFVLEMVRRSMMAE
jgi:chromate transport protein ChrA